MNKKTVEPLKIKGKFLLFDKPKTVKALLVCKLLEQIVACQYSRPDWYVALELKLEKQGLFPDQMTQQEKDLIVQGVVKQI